MVLSSSESEIDVEKSIKKNINKSKEETRETINGSTIAVIHIFLNGHLSEASVINSKYIKMTGLQNFS